MSKNIKNALLLLAVLACGWMLYARFTNTAPGETGALDYKIGVILPITGKFAAISEDIQNAILLAEDMAEREGRPGNVSFIFEDSAGQPQRAVSIAADLIANKKVGMIIAGTGSTANIAVSKVAEDNGVPFFAVTSTPELMGKKDYVFTLQPSVNREVEEMITFISKNQSSGDGYKTVAVLYDPTSDSLTEGARLFRDSAVRLGMSVPVFEGYAQEGDQNTVNAKVKASNADLVYMIGADKAVGPIAKKLREVGFKGDMAGFSGIESAEFVSIAGSSSEGVLMTSVNFSCEDKRAESYCAEYKKKFRGRHPQQYGAFIYDLVTSLMKDETCLSMSGKERSRCFLSLDYSDTIMQSFKFDDSGDISENVPLSIKRVVDGKFVSVE